MSDALASAHKDLHERVKQASVLYTDATTWARQGKLKTAIVLASDDVTSFFIRDDGCQASFQPLFVADNGILVSDRASVFGFWAMHLRQICWAHLIRKFVSFAQRAGPAGQIGRDLLTMGALVFDYWHSFLDGKLDRVGLVDWMGPIRSAVTEQLQRAVSANIKRLSGSCANMLQHAQALWTFVEHEGVEPTNNHSEQELRPLVIWRKTSFGSQSEGGDRFAERILSVVHSAHKLGRCAHEFVVDAVRAHVLGRQSPTLVTVTR